MLSKTNNRAKIRSKIASSFIFALFSLCFAGHPISIDGVFDDWDQVPITYSDAESDALGADFSTLKISYDNEFIFIYFDFFQGEFLMQDWNEFHLYIDSDNNDSTGFYVNGIGAELKWNFGSRSGYAYLDNQQIEIYQNDLSLRIAPTITSSQFEIAISRNSFPLTDYESQTVNNFRIFISEFDLDGDFIPEEAGGILFSIGEDFVPQAEPILIDRVNEDDIRLVSYNTWNEGILDSERQNQFKRILQALDPDVILLQEHSDWDQIDNIIQSWFPNEVWHASWTYGDLVVLSRFPIINDAFMNSERTMVALLYTEDELGKNLLVFNSHLSCCDNNEDRQKQVDQFAAEWRDWRINGLGPFEIDYGTPFVHVGDFNFVGYRQQVETIRIGDIEDEAQYGNDFLPDWDSTAIIDLFLRHTDIRMGYTWRKDASSFNPGKLDYVFYSDATIDTGKHYILNTLCMDGSTLIDYGLQLNDTQEASDHLPLIFDISKDENLDIKEEHVFSKKSMLDHSYPNPFNAKIHIVLSLLTSSVFELSIIDLKGAKIRTLHKGKKSKGMYQFKWDGRDEIGNYVVSGIYFILIKTEQMRESQKIILIK